MRHFTARRLAFAALVPALLALSVIPGCSNQSEGERCGDQYSATNNDDCQSGLVCTPIAGGTDQVNRCCFADGHVTDSRCVIGGSSSATSGAGATSTGGGTSADAGGAAGQAVADAGAAGAL